MRTTWFPTPKRLFQPVTGLVRTTGWTVRRSVPTLLGDHTWSHIDLKSFLGGGLGISRLGEGGGESFEELAVGRGDFLIDATRGGPHGVWSRGNQGESLDGNKTTYLHRFRASGPILVLCSRWGLAHSRCRCASSLAYRGVSRLGS